VFYEIHPSGTKLEIQYFFKNKKLASKVTAHLRAQNERETLFLAHFFGFPRNPAKFALWAFPAAHQETQRAPTFDFFQHLNLFTKAIIFNSSLKIHST